MEISVGNNLASKIDAEAESQPNQEIQTINPIEKNRKPTDRYFVIVVLFLLFIWIGISVSGLSHSQTDDVKGTLYHWRAFINAPVTTLRHFLPTSLFLCMSVIWLCLFAYQKFPEGCIYVSVIVSLLGIIGYIFFIFYSVFAPLPTYTPIYSIVIMRPMVATSTMIYCLVHTILHIIFVVTSAVSFFKVDVKVLCDMARDSCGLIRSSWPLSLFAWFISILVFLVLSLTLNAFIVDIQSTRVDSFFGIIILLGGMYVINLITSYAHMVISEYSINYSYTKDKNPSIGKIFVKTLSDRVGTAMFASTMFVSFICAVIKAFKHKPTWSAKKNIYYVVTRIALVMSPDTALIFSSIYGTGYLESYQKTFDAVLRRPTSYLAMLIVIDGICTIIFFGMIIPIAILVTISSMSVDMNHINSYYKDSMKNEGLIFYGMSYTLFTYTLMISSTMKGQLINKIIILNKEEQRNENKIEMLKRF